MVEVKGLKFATSLGVLFALKEKRGHKTLQETFNSTSKTDIDNMLDVLQVCYEKAEGKTTTTEEFIAQIEEHGIGFLKVTSVFTKVLEGLMYSGMSEEEMDAAKKLAEQKLPS